MPFLAIIRLSCELADLCDDRVALVNGKRLKLVWPVDKSDEWWPCPSRSMGVSKRVSDEHAMIKLSAYLLGGEQERGRVWLHVARVPSDDGIDRRTEARWA